MLMAMSNTNLHRFIFERGGSDKFLFNGIQVTKKIKIEVDFESFSRTKQASNLYRCILTPTADERFFISEDRKFVTKDQNTPMDWRPYKSDSNHSRIESQLYNERNEKAQNGQNNGVGYFVYKSISNWMVYHFHDTSTSAPMRRSEIIEDNQKLRGNASNISPFLLNLRKNSPRSYKAIINSIHRVMPFFDDLLLDVQKLGEESKVRLSWTQKGSDYPMQPYHLSDGSIRFICLATALLQPNPPSAIIIDEPELGLHPAAIVILAELIQQAAQRTQVIVATQSPALIDQFAVDDIVVVNRKEGASTFQRLNEEDFSEWLEDYSIGELWTKNVIAGGPVYE